MKAYGVAFAFMFAGVATAAELSFEAPPPQQVFTPISAVDWTGFYLAARQGWVTGNTSDSFSDSLFGTPFPAPELPFRSSGWLGALHAGYEIQDGQIVHATEGNIALSGIHGAAGRSAAETLAGEVTIRGMEDRSGRTTLGVDISRAGSTSAKVRRFLERLPADAASKVRTGCATVMVDQANHHPALVRFCTALPQKSVSLP